MVCSYTYLHSKKSANMADARPPHMFSTGMPPETGRSLPRSEVVTDGNQELSNWGLDSPISWGVAYPNSEVALSEFGNSQELSLAHPSVRKIRNTWQVLLESRSVGPKRPRSPFKTPISLIIVSASIFWTESVLNSRLSTANKLDAYMS